MPPGRVAFNKLMKEISATPRASIRRCGRPCWQTPVPNAFALPGGKVYLFNGLLAKAENPDEIAGVLAHELGHVSHRDNTRNMIYSGGTSFLIGLLFGDVTGSGAMIFASRSLFTASYSREAEQGADDFSIDVMHRLGRPTKPMGDLIFRITGNQGGQDLVDPGQPSAHRRPAEAPQRRKPSRERAAAVDRGGMDVAEGDLQVGRVEGRTTLDLSFRARCHRVAQIPASRRAPRASPIAGAATVPGRIKPGHAREYGASLANDEGASTAPPPACRPRRGCRDR